MRRTCRLSLLIAALTALPAHATPAEAERLQEEFRLKMETWSLATRTATSPEEREAAMAKQPDAQEYARRMWSAISGSLDQAWTLEPAAWFVGLAQSLPGQPFAAEIAAVRTAVEKHHMASPDLAPLCLVLANTSDPRSLSLLEKIEADHDDPRIQGVAALGAAMILKSLGDDPELMRKRITHIRKAIIESADVSVSGTSVAELAEEELYIILHLTKGRVAPDLQGVDSGGRPMKLSDHAGKVVVLLFWGSNIPDADRTVEIANEMAEKFRGRPFALVGVNHDPVPQLRALQENGTVDWPNFSDPENKLAREYRVGSWPLAYVLDHELKIHYAGAVGSFAELTAEALLEDLANAEKPDAE